MNRTYRLVWNRVRNLWAVAAEIAPTRGKGNRGIAPRASLRRIVWLMLPLSLPVVASAAVSVHAPGVPTTDPAPRIQVAPRASTAGAAVRAPASVSASAGITGLAPTAQIADMDGLTGGHIVAGQGNIRQSGRTATITQRSQNLSLTWQTFDIGAQDTVNFLQPNAHALAVNRIADPNGSVILGHLNANGQVWLINPNGILFGRGAQVNVGGLVASTLDAGTNTHGTVRFSGDGAGNIVNRGTITTAHGGYAALIGAQVSNQGSIDAPAGSVALGAGRAVDLQLDGDRLVSLQVTQGALDALAENRQLIRADGGRVLMTAGAKNSLLASVVNNTGVIQAHTVAHRDGHIVLLAGAEAGAVNVGGTLDASAPKGGDGGFIETSGAHVHVADSTQVNTLAPFGQAGTWLIDPQDFTIATTGGDMTPTLLQTNLGTSDVQIKSSGGATAGAGDINVNGAVSWSANTLTLDAQHDININSPLTASGSAGLVLQYGQGAVAAGNTATYNINAPVSLAATGSFSTQLGSDGTPVSYTIITSLGAAGSTTKTDLQGINGNLAGHYVLGANIDASATSGWSSGAGFAPLGSSTPFTGVFDGLGHTVSGVTISSGVAYTGLFGHVGGGGVVRNVGLLGGSVTGPSEVGALVGYNDVGGTVTDAYATSAVTAMNFGVNIGGLVGINKGTLANVYATGSVTGGINAFAGGLVGFNSGTITDAYATGEIAGGPNSHLAGLVGTNNGTEASSYWDTDTTGLSAAVGSGDSTGATGGCLGGSCTNGGSVDLSAQATFTGAGWQFGTSDSAPWAIVDGKSYPYFHWQFAAGVTPLVVSGTLYTDAGSTAAGGGIAVDGLSGGNDVLSMHTGANGYYYSLLAPGALTGNSLLLYAKNYGSGGNINGATFVGGYTSALPATLNILGNTLDIQTNQTAWSSVLDDLASAEGGSAATALASSLPVTGLTALGLNTAGAFSFDDSLNWSGNLDMTAGGAIAQSAGITVAGTSRFDAGGNAITLGSTANDFSGAVSLTNSGADDVMLGNGSNALTLGSVNLGSGIFSVSSSTPVTLTQDVTTNGGKVNLGGAMTLDASAITIDTTGSGATGANISFGSTVDNATATAEKLTVDAGTGAVTFGGAVGGGTNGALDSLDVTGDNIDLSGGSIKTTNSQTYNGAVALNNAATLTANGVTFNGTVDSAGGSAIALTVHPGSGAVAFDDAVGSTSKLGALTVDGTGAVSVDGTFDAGTVNVGGNFSITSTGGDITQGGAWSVGGVSDFNAGGHAITLNHSSNDFSGAVSLTNSGANDVMLGNGSNALTLGSVNLGSGIFSVSSSTPVTLTNDVTTNGGKIDFGGAVTLDAPAITVDTTDGIAGGAGNNISFNGTVDGTTTGSNGLVLNAGTGGAVTFGDAVGGGMNGALDSLDVTGDSIDISGGSVKTAGGQTYHGAVVLNNGATLTGDGVTFDGTVDGAGSAPLLTVNAGSGAVAFDDAVGSGSTLGALTINGTGTTTFDSTVQAKSLATASGTNTLSGDVTTTGTQTYKGAVLLGTGATLTTADNDVTFDGTVDNATNGTPEALTVAAGTGDVSFGGAVGGGANGALAALSVTGSGATTLKGDVTTSGDQTYTGAVFLDDSAGDNSLALTGANVSFNSTLDNTASLGTDQALTVDVGTSGVATFTGAVGGTNGRLGALTLDAGGYALFSGTVDADSLTAKLDIRLRGDVTTHGAQDYEKTLDVFSPALTLTSNNHDITLTDVSNQTAAATLAVDAGSGSVAFSGDICSGTAACGNALGLDVTATGGITEGASGVIGGSGALSFNAGTGAGAGGITLDKANTFTGAVSLAGGAAKVTDADALKLGAVNVASLQAKAGGDITQTTTDNVTVSGTSTFDAGTHAITLANASNSFGGLIGVTSGGAVEFGGTGTLDIGAMTNVNSLTLDNAATLHGDITTSGAQIYKGAVALGGGVTLTTANSDVDFVNTVDSATSGTPEALTISAGTGAVYFQDAVGGGNALGALTLNGSGSTQVFGNITTAGAQTYDGSLDLFNPVTLKSNGGAITFDDVSNQYASPATLTVNAGSGTVVFNGAVCASGCTKPLGLDVTASGGISEGSSGEIHAGVDSSFDAGAAAITLTNANNDFTGAVTLTGGATQITTAGALALGKVNVGSLVAKAGGAINQSTTVADAVTVSGTSSFTTGGYAIDLGNTGNDLTGAVSLTNSGANNVTLDNGGHALTLGNVKVGSGSLVVNGAGITQTATTSITQAAGAGTATFDAGTADALTLNNTGNDFTGQVAATGADVSITDTNDLAIASLSDAINHDLSLIAGGTLTGVSAFDAGTGDITLAAGSGALSTGALSGGDIAVTASSGVLTTSTLVGKNIALTGGDGITLSDSVTADGALTLTSGAGISQDTGAVITADTLTGNAVGATGLGESNAITTLDSFTANGFSLDNGQALTVATGNTVDGGTTGTALTATTGDLAINGTVGNMGGVATLTSAGAISEGPDGVVHATTLTGSSVGATSLTGNNAVASLGNFTADGFNLTTTQALTVATGSTVDGGSNVTLTTTTGGLSVAGTLTVDSATGQLLVDSGGNVSLDAGASLAAHDITLVAADAFVNNAGSGVLTTGSGGRWLVWSASPSSDTLGGLDYDFMQYDATYDTSAVAGTGDGVLYTLAPTLTITLVGSTDKTYDADTGALLDASNYKVTGARTGDSVSVAAGAANYADKNVGHDKEVTATGLSVQAKNGNVAVYGYGLNHSAHAAIGNITPASLTLAGLSADNKVYDTTTAATAHATLAGILGHDAVSDTLNARFVDKNVGTGKTVTVNGITLGGADAGNYVIAAGETTTASITPAALTLTGLTADNKVYDATAVATAHATLAGVLGHDAVSDRLTASFANKNVGTGKTVTVDGISLGGADAGNYVVAGGGSTTANITPASLVLADLTADSKVYDATTTATAHAALAGILGHDDVIDALTASFADKNVGTGKRVTVNGITLSGADAGNYSVATGETTTANITPATLTLTGLSAENKVYDATTVATANAALFGVLGHDDVTDTLHASFADKNAGTGKPVRVNGIILSGADAGNYIVGSGQTTTADITPATLTLTGLSAENKVYDATTTATASAALAGVLGHDDVGDALTANFADKNVGADKRVTVADVTLTGADAGNYVIADGQGTTADITPATLTYLADPAAFAVGQAAHGLTGTVEGLAGGESLAEATDGTLSWSTTASNSSPAGSYAIDGHGLTARNYVFVQAPGNVSALSLRPNTVPVSVRSEVAGLQQLLMAPYRTNSLAHTLFAGRYTWAVLRGRGLRITPSSGSRGYLSAGGLHAPDVRVVDGGVRLP